MKHRVFVSALMGTVTVLWLLSSCASGPKPSPETEEPPVQVAEETVPAEKSPEITDQTTLPPDQETENRLAEAAARAEKSRKQAFDLEVPTTFAEEWKNAEAYFLSGREKAKVKTMASYQEATNAYFKAADAYDELALKALPLYAQARRNELLSAREAAVNAGAELLLPSQLAAADAVADKAQAQFDAGDYYGAADSVQEARTRYIVIKTAIDAYRVQQEIEQRDFAQYDAGNYALAQEKLSQAEKTYEEGDITASRNYAEEALLRFRLALNKGKEMNATGREQRANLERQAAQDLKANVAVKADFDAAMDTLRQAQIAFKAEKYDDAAELFKQAEQQFAAVKDVAADKRSKALEVLQQAQKKIESTQEAAKQADAVLEGGVR
ncbi:MAG: hypothetical protein SNJ56_01740 [Termitinemataceae bacterium]